MTFSFSAAQDELYARGWPHVCRLVEAAPAERAIRTAVDGELRAGDPYFSVDVPREVARRFLRAMEYPRGSPGRDAAITSTDPVDARLARAIVVRLCPSMAEIYDFRVRDAAFLCEAFLGTPAMVAILVERLAIAAADVKQWEQRDNGNDHAFALASALGDMRPRLADADFRAATRALANGDASLLLTERLALLVDPKRPVPTGNETLELRRVEIAMERGDRAALRAMFEVNKPSWHWWYPARFFYVAGADLLDRLQLRTVVREPPWRQKQIIAQHGTIQHAVVARIAMWLLSKKAAHAEATAWLRDHAAFARPILAKVGADEKELARAALAAIDGDAPAEPSKPAKPARPKR
jgi:hypothetical protein